ncbi:MAG: hypothetical protein ACI3YF_01480, partial [Prevotella sp.]
TKVCPYALRVAFCHPQSAVSSPYTTCDTGVCQLEYGRTAIGVRPYGNCDTVRICHYGCWKQPLMAVTEIYSGLQRIYAVGAPSVALYDREQQRAPAQVSGNTLPGGEGKHYNESYGQ